MKKNALLFFLLLGLNGQAADYKIYIYPPLSPINLVPALVDTRYFLQRFIFYFNKQVKSVTWNGVPQTLAVLDDGPAALIFANPEYKVFPFVNRLEIVGNDDSVRGYQITFTKQGDPEPEVEPAQVVAGVSPSVVSTSSNERVVAQFYTPSVRSSLRLLSFDAMAFSAFPVNGDNGFAPLIAWTPQFHFSSSGYVSLSIGFSPMKTMTRDFIVTTEYQVLAAYRWRLWSVNAGGGIQVWHKRSGAAPLLSVGTRYYHGALRDRSQAWLLAGYSAYLPPSGLVHELRFGLGFEI